MRCDESLRERIRGNLVNFQAEKGVGDKLAAVALVVVELGYGAGLADFRAYQNWQERAALLLTTRSKRLRNHPGQWALPGGRIEAGETACAASLREMAEEIGLFLTDSAFLGQLDDFVTRSGFVMTPLVFWGRRAAGIKPNPDEVASIHRIPIQELMREDAPILTYNEVETDRTCAPADNHPVLRMPIGQNWIAAPTAAILYQFREVCILGRNTRVAHYEQPHFAWR